MVPAGVPTTSASHLARSSGQASSSAAPSRAGPRKQHYGSRVVASAGPNPPPQLSKPSLSGPLPPPPRPAQGLGPATLPLSPPPRPSMPAPQPPGLRPPAPPSNGTPSTSGSPQMKPPAMPVMPAMPPPAMPRPGGAPAPAPAAMPPPAPPARPNLPPPPANPFANLPKVGSPPAQQASTSAPGNAFFANIPKPSAPGSAANPGAVNGTPIAAPLSPPPRPPPTANVSAMPLAPPPARPQQQQGQKHGGAQGGSMPTGVLIKPDPPPLRVLEPLMPPPGAKPAAGAGKDGASAGAAGRRRVDVQEVVEDDSVFDAEDGEFLNKGSGMKAKGKKGGRKEKVTAAMRREARKMRVAAREEKAQADRKDKEEIFEVGEEGMTLDELAELLQVDESTIVRTLFMKGVTLSMTQALDRNTVKVVAAEFDVLVVDKDESKVPLAKKRQEYITEEDIDDLVARPPVVTVMGHVDHGKTSLLDYIRKARVAAGEAGGITQSIGAYNTAVEVEGEKKTVCLLDTPGHEAFSAMRARGAQVTDIAIIIVAADDGVRPQTREAVAHAQAAEVPIIVAINKIDKSGADVERVKQDLLELNLVPEEWGGTTPMVPVSAKKGTGVPDLLTQVLWVAEEKQLMANPKRAARGMVIEANLDKKRGAVATLLVQTGTLRVGDIVRAGSSVGKVRSLVNDMGQPLAEAGPSIAAQVTGLSSVPAAGEEFEVHPTDQSAREAAAEFAERYNKARLAEMSGGGSMVTLSSLATVDEDQEAMQRINLIVKADTMGMVEAIKAALGMLPQLSITLRFLLANAGDITVSDVDLAAASGAWVLTFNTEPDDAVEAHAKKLGVNVKSYRIIYDLIDDVKALMEGKLKLVEERVPTGSAVVKALFGNGKKRVAGCAVTDGKLVKNAYVTVTRGKTVVFDGKLSSLRRVKDLVEEVPAGLECGVACEDFLEWSEGDTIECYQLQTKSRRLEDAKATVAVDVSKLQM